MELDISPREQLLKAITAWAISCPDIKALAVVGSGSRVDHPADEWSDIDLIMLAGNPAVYLESSAWLKPVGEIWVATVERNQAREVTERRVLFRSGVDVDFLVLAAGDLAAFQQEPLASITSRGMHVLLDKDHLLSLVQPGSPAAESPIRPSDQEFAELVNDFWFHAVWTTKKIKRGEFWTAKSCCDVYLKRLLLSLLEWQAHALDGGGINTWYNGRFIEQWAPASTLAGLRQSFAHYNQEDICRALLETMALFDRIAAETAQQLGYAYPADLAQTVRAWIAHSI